MKYTSKELSKKLAEAGCEIESDQWWCCTTDGVCKLGKADKYNPLKKYRAYDLIWDICIKHAKEFFGEEADVHGLITFCSIAANKTQEAEDYILDHTIFNPKNKKQ